MREQLPAEREWTTRAFLGFLGIVTCLYAIVLIYHIARPVGSVAASDGLLERCRQICLKYGLVSTGHVRKDAEAFLAAANSRRLTSSLHEMLSDAAFVPAATQDHALLNKPAPAFKLPDESNQEKSLAEIGRDRPLVVVFYLGYGCSHCVAQLLAIDKDLHYFRELDAEVVAISQDLPEHTAERFKEFGSFQFPVLADVDNSTAEAWGPYVPPTDDADEDRLHGTFVVDRRGIVIWASMGHEPFLDNRSLLHVLARSQGLLPAESSVITGDPEVLTSNAGAPSAELSQSAP
jgi:peroxiredoxin